MEAFAQTPAPGRTRLPQVLLGPTGIISFSSYHWGLVSPGTARLSHLFSVTQLLRTRIIMSVTPGKPRADGGQEEVAHPEFQPSLAQLVKLPRSRAL